TRGWSSWVSSSICSRRRSRFEPSLPEVAQDGAAVVVVEDFGHLEPSRSHPHGSGLIHSDAVTKATAGEHEARGATVGILVDSEHEESALECPAQSSNREFSLDLRGAFCPLDLEHDHASARPPFGDADVGD